MPLRLIILILLGLFVLWLLFKTFTPYGEFTKWRLFIIVVCVGILFQQGQLEYKWIKQENVMSTVVLPITETRTTVHCQRLWEAMFYARAFLGYVNYGEDGPEKRTMLTWETCRDFRDWLYGDKTNASREQIISVHVLAHEAQHMGGERNEAIAECHAAQWMPWIAESLGASPDEAKRMSSYYFENIYPNMDTNYKSSDCREDGPLDMYPGDGSWPKVNIPVTVTPY